MFIDERGNLQFDSIEEMKANRELAIAEFDKWIIPTVEEIELDVVDGIQTSLSVLETFNLEETFGSNPAEIVSNMIYIMKLGIETAQSIFDEEIGIDSISLKFNDYANRFYLACDKVQEQLAA